MTISLHELQATVPTKISQLTNDSNFMTNSIIVPGLTSTTLNGVVSELLDKVSAMSNTNVSSSNTECQNWMGV